MTDPGMLARILDEQCAVCAKMLGIEQEKSRALLRGDADALLAALGPQQALMMAQRALEARRTALCGASEPATLRALIEGDPACREALEPAFLQLRDTVIALKKLNARNLKLLEARMATVRFMSERMGLGTSNPCARAVQVRA